MTLTTATTTTTTTTTSSSSSSSSLHHHHLFRHHRPLRPSLSLPLLLLLLLLSLCASPPPLVHAQRNRPRKPTRAPLPNVPWRKHATFQYRHDLSDEFDKRYLDERKWDVHGTRNPETGCPLWNGPLSTVANDVFSTYYPTTTNPNNVRGPKVREYRVADGMLWLRIAVRPEKYFAARQYYCNPKTFRCNHDYRIKCHWTDAYGNAILDKRGRYAGVTHDKCKKEPFCLPHHRIVLNRPRMQYRKYASTHITGTRLFKYGYVETRVKLADSSAVLAVWMHGQDSTGDGYCRFKLVTVHPKGLKKWQRKRAKPRTRVVRECPSRVNSERWSEIDIVEAMNSGFHKRKYVPNCHVFQCSKGEFTARRAAEDPAGGMGGGPIVINTLVENQALFGHVPRNKRIANSFHMSSGSLYDLDRNWAAAERTIGMYWSAREIRFYVDGEEVRAIENTIMHQPMAMDVSMSLNVAWAKEAPVDKEIQQWAGVDYVRVWDVFTHQGNDPPRDKRLKFGNVMRRKFTPRYGYNLRGVFDVYPDNDDKTVVLVNGKWVRERQPASNTNAKPQNKKKNRNQSGRKKKAKRRSSAKWVSSTRLLRAVNASGGRDAFLDDGLQRSLIRGRPLGEEALHARELTFARKADVDALLGAAGARRGRTQESVVRARVAAEHGMEEGGLDIVRTPSPPSSLSFANRQQRQHGDEADGNNSKSHTEDGEWLFAGGAPAIRGVRRKRKWSAAERTSQLSRPDRAARVHRVLDKVFYEYIGNAAQTAFDEYDPMQVGAGWAAADGNGGHM